MKRPVLLLTLFVICSSLLFAQDDNGEDEWDVTEHLAETKQVSFETTEGTWMNLDVSPDGEEVVFDLLGNIYVMPIEGGEANVVRESIAYEVQPRFSPDGSKISFTSDAGGGDNIWVMNRDGSNARQITEEDFRLLNNADWTPDGNYLVARKHFTSTRSLGAGEIWMFHVTGGSGIQLTERPNDQQDVGQPVVSPDGRYVYYSQDVYPGGYFQYNKDPNSQIYAINRYDREEGDIERVTGGPGGAISPTISPDGTKLAFVKRVRTKSVLYVRDLETGIEKPVYDNMSPDQQQAWAIFGPYTNIDWTPDGNNLVFWANGKINKLNVETLAVEQIPFEAEINYEVAEAVQYEFDPAPETFTAKAIRHAVTSPDGETLIFNAAGYLWKKELPRGTPERLTDESNLEFEPSFSSDGNKLVYVTWHDVDMGNIKVLDITQENATPETITDRKGIYREPSFSPDGETILFRREGGNNHQGHAYTVNPGIYTIPATGGEQTLILDDGENPIFNADGSRIFYLGGSYLGNEFKSMNLNGEDHKTHFTSKYANNFVPSPDNQWVAFNELFKVYIAPMPAVGSGIELNADTKAIPVTHVAKDAGISLNWSDDGNQLHWTLGEKYFSVKLQEAFNFLSGENNHDDELPLGTNEGIDIGLELELDIPSGTIAFTNAHIITMNEDEVIENGTIVLNQNRIQAVGSADEIEIPSEADIVDVEGKTIMPGLVDAHAHIGNFRQGLSPNQQWEYFANLAYGVTTAHDPSSDTEMIFSQSEMVKAGNMVGPRIFSTGRILYGAEAEFKAIVNNLEDARSAVRRTKAFGATSVKSYNQPRRDQRQQVLQAAREIGINVMPEGGSTFTHNMSMIIDGHTGIEHNVPIYPLYNDVLTLWSNTDVGYTPTLVVNYGSMSGEYYWYQHTNVWEKERLLNFTPRPIIDSRSRHRTKVPEAEYEMGHMLSAASADDLHDLGVTVNIGAHGQLQGLGAHWETWMFEQGGMSNHEALKVATINGANYIGVGDHLGTLEEGKLADLIVIDGNPLENLRDTENVVYTMVNGRLYDASTMNEVGNHPDERLPFWWEQLDYDEQFDWHAIIESDNIIQCSCQTKH
ncbi:amidohydrolase family protein [Rhodohalobacter sulfatireducens]|uniref:Amidohydrolase family protein n=1 Tax=Rhodohalobacter sulfatireducens TaxID=2911366 RepID=A0ABS9KH56_9BACT|nr:amidohydrolase family protein [Rhodohalobacter sulfatireducens]MCG2590187.1 amidohydrolase family protein [Rhodohalobacter sulfatireducens]